MNRFRFLRSRLSFQYGLSSTLTFGAKLKSSIAFSRKPIMQTALSLNNKPKGNTMWFNKGKSHANQNLGQVNPSTFSNDADRKAYQAGWNNAKK